MEKNAPNPTGSSTASRYRRSRGTTSRHPSGAAGTSKIPRFRRKNDESVPGSGQLSANSATLLSLISVGTQCCVRIENPRSPSARYKTRIMPGGSGWGRVAFAVAILLRSCRGAFTPSPNQPCIAVLARIPSGNSDRTRWKGAGTPVRTTSGLRYAECLNESNTKEKDGKLAATGSKSWNRIDQRKGKKLTVLETAAQAADLLTLQSHGRRQPQG